MSREVPPAGSSEESVVMKPAQRTFAVLVAGSIANAVSGFYAGGLGGRVVDGRRAFVVANEKENSPFAALINAAKAAADSAKAAADSLVPIDDTPLDDEYNSSPERLARLTEQQRIAERKREERQDALFKQPPSSPPPLKSPLEKLFRRSLPSKWTWQPGGGAAALSTRCGRQRCRREAVRLLLRCP